MEIGYAFLKIEPGEKKKVLESLKTIRGVKEANIVLGVFDAVVRIEGETIPDIERIYFNEVERVPGLKSSHLSIVACPRTRK